jgi:iron complex transport system substrate-binding protein
MKKVTVLLFLIVSIFSFSFKIIDGYVHDTHGNKVELKEYQRFVVLDPSTVETMFLTNVQHKIVAMGHTTRSPIWPFDETPKIATVGTITRPSLETVLSFEPDIVILNSMIPDFGETLSNYGIKVLVNSTGGLNDIFETTRVVGMLAGKAEETDELVRIQENKLTVIKQNLRSNPLYLKGAFLYATNPIMAFRGDSLPGDILNLLGVINIAEGVIGERPILSAEYILKQNPDFLIGAMSLASIDDILNSSEVIQYTKAGRNKNMFIIDSSKLLRPSLRVVDEIENLYNDLKNMK